MQSAIFDTPVLKSESLKTKFDTCIVSNSFVALIGDYIEARIVQQLHYWCYSEYGVIINDLRWIYKPIREWLSESFVGFTSWQLRKAIASLVAKGILFKKHLFKEHHGNNFSPKNRTYYYSVNYEYLEKLFLEQESAEARPAHGEPSSPSFLAESTENVRFVSSTKQFCKSSEKQFCDSAKNKTKNTSIENNSIDQSHPHLPCVSKVKKENDKEQNLGNPEVLQNKGINSFDLAEIYQDTNDGKVEDKINQNTCTNKIDLQESVRVESAAPKPKTKTPKGTKPNRKRRSEAPWKDQGQFKRFYRTLIQALPIVANARSAQGLAQTIIRQLRSGIPHSYWDDFVAGLPIGSSTKPEWEIEPGVPYPMFIEYLTEKLRAGNNTKSDEQTRNEVFSILEKPRQAKAFWGQFKRSVVNVSEQVERDRALGVSNPNTPVWTRERIEPSIKEAAAAGDKIMVVNGATQAVLESADALANLPTDSDLKSESQVAVHSAPSGQIPQLESKDSHVSTSQKKSKEVSPSPDPWSDRPTDNDCAHNESQPTMREMLAQRRVKGFCKPMPKALKDTATHISQSEIKKEERAEIKPKNNIATMAIAEINEYLKDPILRAQLTPQLLDSNYELITDKLGQIIRVELSELQKRENRRLERE